MMMLRLNLIARRRAFTPLHALPAVRVQEQDVWAAAARSAQ
jgi:hypothetical protein